MRPALMRIFIKLNFNFQQPLRPIPRRLSSTWSCLKISHEATQQQQFKNDDIPQAVPEGPAAIQDSEDGGISDVADGSAKSEDLESDDSNYDLNEASSDEEAEVLTSERARKQALETLKQANERERIAQIHERQLPA